MNVLQLITNGVAHCPLLIESEKDALIAFGKMAKDNGMEYDYDKLINDYSKKYALISEFITTVQEYFEHTGDELLWWDADIE